MSASPPVERHIAERAALSAGTSAEAIYRAVRRALLGAGVRGRVCVDVGAGAGGLRPHLAGIVEQYWAVDAVRYDALPADVRFVQADLDRPPIALPDACADLAVAVEVVEHLDDPRRLVREMVRMTRPGGWIVITTPNQVSLLNLLSLAVKQRHVQFSDASYPAHRTALLPVDLRRIAAEAGISEASLAWTRTGRMPGTARHWPAFLGRLSPRLFSDTVILLGRKAA